MSDNFDELLKSKIKSSFGELEIAYDPEHWNALKNRIESRAGFFRFPAGFMKIAAALLVGAVLALAYIVTRENETFVIQDSITKREIPPPAPRQENIPTPPGIEHKAEPDLDSNPAPETNTGITISHSIDAPFPANSVQRKTVPNGFIRNQESLLQNALTPVKPNSRPLKSPAVRAVNLKPTGLKPELSVQAATNIGFSRAENDVPLGFSAGFGSAFFLSEKISISTGLSISQQNLRIENSGPGITIESSTDDMHQFTRADLLALDIPVNFRFHIPNSGMNRSFISLGLSSYLYLQQDFTSTVRQVSETSTTDSDGTVTTTREITEQHIHTSEPAFSSFDAARMINLSFGIQYPVFPGKDIIFEPFLKYPIAPLTSKDTRFGLGGMHIKVEF